VIPKGDDFLTLSADAAVDVVLGQLQAGKATYRSKGKSAGLYFIFGTLIADPRFMI
jgi:hypothetical protein